MTQDIKISGSGKILVRMAVFKVQIFPLKQLGKLLPEGRLPMVIQSLSA
ncbi:MAG: hypothetical protein IPO33_16755 [Saprospiraceae bacterium]|nr:hypothetical protein [Candidatus Brachybacter algidus]